MNDDLGIGPRIETMTLPLEGGSQAFEVIDFAVEDDPNRTIFVMDRLMACGQIDNAEPAHTEAHAVLHVIARIIRSAMHHGIAHRLNFVFKYRLPAEAQQTGDSTHTSSSL